MKQDIAILDLGTDTICASIIKPEKKKQNDSIAIGNTTRVLGVGYQLTKGLKRGAIINLEELEDSILEAVRTAEKEAQKSVKSMLVAIPSWAVESRIITNSIEIGQLPVDDVHVRTLANFVTNKQINPTMEIIHIFPISYSIDDIHAIIDPIGMVGKTLSAAFHVMYIQSSFAQNIRNCLSRNNIKVEEFICSTYASSLSVLLDDEISSGVTLIDIGGSTTSICPIIESIPICLVKIPVGSQNITNDISMVLRTTKSNGERLKILYGVSTGNAINEIEHILVPKIDEYGEEHIQNISKGIMDTIITARIEEVLELVQDKIYQLEIDKFLYQRIVITGGGSRISGLNELIKSKQFFNELSVRLGKPIGTIGSHDFVQTASFSTSAGVALYSCQAFRSNSVMKLVDDRKSFSQKLVTWFRRGI
ncbi:MAG: cell division protein FtsA [Holosporales bacterium]|jgi:cell division protein FtsA|nr:cell division protein FtsA [Holosporales bacterium]